MKQSELVFFILFCDAIFSYRHTAMCSYSVTVTSKVPGVPKKVKTFD